MIAFGVPGIEELTQVEYIESIEEEQGQNLGGTSKIEYGKNQRAGERVAWREQVGEREKGSWNRGKKDFKAEIFDTVKCYWEQRWWVMKWSCYIWQLMTSICGLVQEAKMKCFDECIGFLGLP